MVLLALAVIALFIGWLVHLNKDYYVLSFFAKRVKTVDGTPLELTAPQPKGRTIFGNAFDVYGMNHADMFQHNREMAAKTKKSYVMYNLNIPFYNVITAEDAEIVLTNPNLLTKGIVYNFMKPFLGLGLLTSTGKYWHTRRKMLTPAFHFNILGQFEEIFKEQSQSFLEGFNMGDDTTKVLSLSDEIPIFTLNSVCETALGVRLGGRMEGSEYRESFKMIDGLFIRRVSNPLLFIDKVYEMFVAKEYAAHLKVVHDFSSEIIRRRRDLFAKQQDSSAAEANEDSEFLKKKRYAMLDTLLMAEKEGRIDHRGICEEVDTFMFEGFDTTSMGLIFSLMNLSLHPDMQERCYQEILQYVDDDLTKLDLTQLSNLKFLECFMKETMRLYPSVPIIMRKAVNETKLTNNLVLPAGTQVPIHIFDILRDPKAFPNPSVFDPERFTPEKSVGRHPYAFIPFSAGQRNCIGQKFAMAEMKTLIVYMLKNYKLLPMVDPDEFRFESGLIIRSQINVKVKLVKRV